MHRDGKSQQLWGEVTPALFIATLPGRDYWGSSPATRETASPGKAILIPTTHAPWALTMHHGC